MPTPTKLTCYISQKCCIFEIYDFIKFYVWSRSGFFNFRIKTPNTQKCSHLLFFVQKQIFGCESPKNVDDVFFEKAPEILLSIFQIRFPAILTVDSSAILVPHIAPIPDIGIPMKGPEPFMKGEPKQPQCGFSAEQPDAGPDDYLRSLQLN